MEFLRRSFVSDLTFFIWLKFFSHASESGMSESENELDVTRSFSQTGDVSMRAYEGDISVATNLDSTNISSDGESPVNKNLPRTVMIQRGNNVHTGLKLCDTDLK